MTEAREIAEGLLYQGADEEIVYTLTITNWGTAPSDVSVIAKDMSAGTVATSTVLSGTATVDGDVITLPTLKSLTAGHRYRVEVKFTAGGSVWETYAYVQGQE